MQLIKNLEWRYATKQFDATKKVENQAIEQLKKAMQLSASSYGLQLYKILIVENQAIKDQLKPASWGQSQISDASHLMVICNYNQVSDEQIEGFLQLKAEKQGIAVENLKGYADFMKSKVAEYSDEELNHWTAKQCYIVLTNLMTACAELKIDSCPIEGFESKKYNEILNLEEKGLNACVVCAVGYRAEADNNQHLPKTRKPLEQLFEIV